MRDCDLELLTQHRLKLKAGVNTIIDFKGAIKSETFFAKGRFSTDLNSTRRKQWRSSSLHTSLVSTLASSWRRRSSGLFRCVVWKRFTDVTEVRYTSYRLYGAQTQKTVFIHVAVRTWNLTCIVFPGQNTSLYINNLYKMQAYITNRMTTRWWHTADDGQSQYLPVKKNRSYNKRSDSASNWTQSWYVSYCITCTSIHHFTDCLKPQSTKANYVQDKWRHNVWHMSVAIIFGSIN